MLFVSEAGAIHIQRPSKLAKMEEEISSLRSKLRQTFQDKVLVCKLASSNYKNILHTDAHMYTHVGLFHL